jgi:hypothetical protein
VPSPPIQRVNQDDTAPAAVWLLGGLGALALLSAVFAGLARWFGWSAAGLTGPSRASWAEFGDWLKTGQ